MILGHDVSVCKSFLFSDVPLLAAELASIVAGLVVVFYVSWVIGLVACGFLLAIALLEAVHDAHSLSRMAAAEVKLQFEQHIWVKSREIGHKTLAISDGLENLAYYGPASREQAFPSPHLHDGCLGN